MSASAAAAGVAVAAREAYRQVSQAYDSEPNPMLALEQRFLRALLPEVANLDVVDLGCGTGRWLAVLAPQQLRSLIGVDASPEMLAQARRKGLGTAKLILADCNCLPLADASADLILCSFAASYIGDLSKLADQVTRLLRPGGTVFLSDLHPDTNSKLRWR